MSELIYFSLHKGLLWSLTDMYVKLSNSDREYFLPFLMFYATNPGLIRYYDRPCLAPAVTNTLKARNVVF